MNLKEKAQNWLNYSLNDPLVKILSKNSNLTKIQIETLLIDVLAENISDKSLKYDEKAKLRILAVSRGAFNRSLRQARQNVTQSIYTILLLGYLGILEEISLEPYLEAANKLKTYINTQRELAKKMPKEEHIRTSGTTPRRAQRQSRRTHQPPKNIKKTVTSQITAILSQKIATCAQTKPINRAAPNTQTTESFAQQFKPILEPVTKIRVF